MEQALIASWRKSTRGLGSVTPQKLTEKGRDTVEEMRIYIANLGKYNEGELVGAWFTPLVDFEEVKERIGLNDEYEEYAIHDYELPFEIDEYTPIEEVNRLCEMVEDLPEYI